MASKTDLFLELAKPDINGFSRWVLSSEFEGKYKELKFGNGGSWCRDSSTLAKKYIVETKKDLTPGNSIDALKLNGYNKEESFSQQIRSDIKDFYKNKKCVMLGVNGKSENTKIEVDHKDGRKNDMRVSNLVTQNYADFQPLCKAANDIKRQFCKECKKTNRRWDAKNIKGNPYSFYKGDEHYTNELGCVGCYQYDPVEYRKQCAKRLMEESARNTENFIMKKIYNDD